MPEKTTPVKGWKVVRKGMKKGQFFSAIVSLPTIYIPGQVTRPRPDFGPLAVFNTLKNAEYYRKVIFGKSKRGIVFPCTYKPSKETFLRTGLHQTPLGCHSVPPGTRLADIVTLKKPVKETR